jgi:twitching motility protein PilT
MAIPDISTSGSTNSTLKPRSKLAAAIMSGINYSSLYTDMLVHEGEKINLKSANGVVSMESLHIPGGDLVVSADDIRHFFSAFIDGSSSYSAQGSYWDSNIVPELARQNAVNRSMSAPNGKFLRFSLIQHQRGKFAIVIRVASAPPALDSVGLTEQIVEHIKTKPRGLLIITGPAASGKTTTALSILDWMNNHRSGHLLTVEEPIEYLLQKNKCIITQREVGVDVSSFGAGLRDAVRLSANAILAGEVRDEESARSAIIGGESGSLMIVTTHGSSVTGTLRKILTYTGHQSQAMREVMAGCLVGVVRQELVPVKDRSGYLMVCDTLHMTDKVRQAVGRGDWEMLDKITDHGAMRNPDFVSMRSQLEHLASKELISPNIAQDVFSN